MENLYARWMKDWENRLCFRATNRVVRPFDWGLEWTKDWPTSEKNPRNGHTPAEYLKVLNEAVLESSDEFFGYETPTDFDLDGNLLRFTSPIKTPYPENNIVHGQWYPAAEKPGRRKVAALVLPHWNASLGQHGALCAGLAKLGVSAMRVSLPYHDYRMPAELQRADYAVSANVARTIDATRQAVVDVRSSVDWLEKQGYESIGICGTSLGSCYAFLASTHDPRIRGERLQPLFDVLRGRGLGRIIDAAYSPEPGIRCDDRTTARGLDGDQPSVLHRPLCDVRQEDAIYLRPLRHDVSGAIFRTGN